MSNKAQMEYDLKYGTPMIVAIRGVPEFVTIIDTRPLHEPAPPIVGDAGSGVYAVPVIDFDGKGPIAWPLGGG